jgi:hypothetical protein
VTRPFFIDKIKELDKIKEQEINIKKSLLKFKKKNFFSKINKSKKNIPIPLQPVAVQDALLYEIQISNKYNLIKKRKIRLFKNFN